MAMPVTTPKKMTTEKDMTHNIKRKERETVTKRSTILCRSMQSQAAQSGWFEAFNNFFCGAVKIDMISVLYCFGLSLFVISHVGRFP